MSLAIFRTALLLGLLSGLLLAIGYVFAGIGGMTVALLMSFLLNFISYWYSDKIVLSWYRAKEVSATEAPKLHELVEKLAKEAKIPKPRVYVIQSKTPNAFATGRSPKHAAVAVTSGLLDLLDEKELAGVLGHEIAHIKARDTLTSTIAATIGGAISYLANLAWYSLFWSDERRSGSNIIFLPLIFLAPLAATLIQLAISRGREFEADRNGAIFSKEPLALASALEKISSAVKIRPMVGNVATSHMWIVNPFKKDAFVNLFSTHPPVEERIRRLKELAKEISA